MKSNVESMKFATELCMNEMNLLFFVNDVRTFEIEIIYTKVWRRHTMWKFGNFSATQILGEITFGHFEEPKTAILAILAALNFPTNWILSLQNG